MAPGSKTVGQGLRDGADNLDEQETQQDRSLVGTALYVGQDRPETQYATKEAARFMSGPTRAANCMLKRLCKYYSEATVLSRSFPYQGMPSEIRAVTDANWAGELDGLRPTSCGWIYFGDHLLETYSSTQQIVALSTAEGQYISITKGGAHALEVRSAMVEYEMRFNLVCETDASVGRAMACRKAQRGRLGNKDGRFEADDLVSERNTPSTANGLEFMDGGGDSPRGCRSSKRLPCTNLEREEYVRDERLVLDLCGKGHCDYDGVVRRTVCESHWSDD